jgi:hypothetical protein
MLRFQICALILQKRMLANEIKIYYLYIYCALITISKFNFESLPDFIEIFKEYLKHCTQNILKNARSNLPIFTAIR